MWTYQSGLDVGMRFDGKLSGSRPYHSQQQSGIFMGQLRVNA